MNFAIQFSFNADIEILPTNPKKNKIKQNRKFVEIFLENENKRIFKQKNIKQ